ncbi:MAG: hypothetical protein LBC20_09290 [Planctomycetaceae bacterium]|jgi:hypothetical protein|nr:hypothetical protein [Planctomycetaceae bacterium]
MSLLSWNEIRSRAFLFINDWLTKSEIAHEDADAQTFENEFFHIFGVPRTKVAVFEKRINFRNDNVSTSISTSVSTKSKDIDDKKSGKTGKIDLFWKGHILIEMKSPGKNLANAYEQAKRYTNTLPLEDMPKGILVCDFVNFHYYDLEDDGKLYQFKLSELVEHIELFGYLAGYAKITFQELDPVNIEAAEKMGRLHDRLKEIGYNGHRLEVYLVRILFCLFADDTGIFEKDFFVNYILNRTNPDGGDLALHIQKIFETLNQTEQQRLQTLDEQLKKFPYVNGDLFNERLEIADFDSKMRETLIDCCRLDWSKISPAIFGAMFQSVMDKESRHDFGAHYTSEENILKLIRPLFMDELWKEFYRYKKLKSEIRKTRLTEFHNKLSRLKFLDPACGCGNFLVISYRELRLLEIEVISELLGDDKLLDIDHYIKVNVNQFYGIEIVEFPSKIAQVALWLMDHQMNLAVMKRFGKYYIRIPLNVSASIHFANAFDIDWEKIVSKNELSYILGNPPFLGYSVMNKRQKNELVNVFNKMKNCGNLDYVTAWYKKAAIYIQDTNIEVAFVSTNSICQGEQVAILWKDLMCNHNVKINFAYQTFKWSNEARGKAAVNCVIVGFSLNDRKIKKLYQNIAVNSKLSSVTANQINGYLIDSPMIFIAKRRKPICNVSEMIYGNKPVDDGNFLLDKNERDDLIKREPELAKIIKPFLGAHEFINNIPRFCIWLNGVSPEKFNRSKAIQERIRKVKIFRESSEKQATKKLAETPTVFGEIRQPESNYIIVPLTSSEKRKYVPIGFANKNIILGNSNSAIPNATLYEFGVITSNMHMSWMRYICGRLEMRYRYSGSLVYNNFPFPNPTLKQKQSIESSAQMILNIRNKYPKSSLADLYDPLSMPSELLKAHQKLDKAVEKAYGKIFENDSQRVAYLFEQYQNLTGELFNVTKNQ